MIDSHRFMQNILMLFFVIINFTIENRMGNEIAIDNQEIRKSFNILSINN